MVGRKGRSAGNKVRSHDRNGNGRMSELSGLALPRCIETVKECQQELEGTGFVASMHEAFQAARQQGEAPTKQIPSC